MDGGPPDQAGDVFVCYMTRLSRWVGTLEVLEGPFRNDTPIFYAEKDPFVVRFRVRPLIWLAKEHAVRFPRIGWENLSFTKGQDRGTSRWTGKVRRSLNQIEPADGELLERVLREQAGLGPGSSKSTRRTTDATSAIGEHRNEDGGSEHPGGVRRGVRRSPGERPEPRESVQIQALLARIGAAMGLRIWLPRSDRTAVSAEWTDGRRTTPRRASVHYDDTTLKTVEQMDVIWIHRRSIARAFEVEHTTSIYSRSPAMADLLALQPNIGIKLHIVAPASRRGKVFQEDRAAGALSARGRAAGGQNAPTSRMRA